MSKTIEEILAPKPTADLHLTRRRGGAEIRGASPKSANHRGMGVPPNATSI
jgi:hypothetical protein